MDVRLLRFTTTAVMPPIIIFSPFYVGRKGNRATTKMTVWLRPLNETVAHNKKRKKERKEEESIAKPKGRYKNGKKK